jgi:hypothetical protein
MQLQVFKQNSSSDLSSTSFFFFSAILAIEQGNFFLITPFFKHSKNEQAGLLFKDFNAEEN